MPKRGVIYETLAAGAAGFVGEKQLAWVNFKLERYPLAISNYESIGDSLGTVDRYYLAQSYAKSNKVDAPSSSSRSGPSGQGELQGVYCNMANAYYEANRYESGDQSRARRTRGRQHQRVPALLLGAGPGQAGPPQGRNSSVRGTLDDPTFAEAAKKELERQRRIVRLLQTK